ncbi:MAG: hypothetical protein H7249_07515 [Chitinophagaceae bacterium]|nr:hypothetical protein [Oligoflexus sp.]
MVSSFKKIVVSFILSTSVLSQSGIAADRDELATKYPDIEAGSLKPENKKILCPFHRLLERAGLYDAEKETMSSGLLVGISKIISATHEFGCDVGVCAGVATLTSTGQVAKGATTIGKVNFEALDKAFGISHDCGLTFAKGGSTVDDAVRDHTLAELFKRTDSTGHLSLQDLKDVKQGICDAQGVKNSTIGRLEVGLIYSFLGGVQHGYIEYDDVVSFLHAELPKTIGKPAAVFGV